MSALDAVRTVADLRARIGEWRAAGESVGLVPTMGALHRGHMALVEASKARCGRTVATLFVNPKQFGENEDFDVYPRSEASDSDMLREAGVDLLFAPGVGEMYPDGFSTSVGVGPIGDILEGAHRPGFFTGVATVVTKLLLQSLPDAAFFGEKDFQQLQVIRRLARDLDIPVEIAGVATVREADGLAMSSRNAYLTDEQRVIAPALHAALNGVANRVRGGETCAEAIAAESDGLLRAGFEAVDYLAVMDVERFEPAAARADLAGRSGRVLGAARIGKTRLIDNIVLSI